MAVKAIPEGYHTVTPYLIVEDAPGLMEFMKRGLGATERTRMDAPGGKIGHAEVQVGDSVIMLSSAMGDFKPTTAMIHLYVEDADAMYQRALGAGATSEQEPKDQFYGDRSAGVRDAFGNQWYLATHVEDVSPEEMQKRMSAMAGAQA